jgi:hypothetical protein
VKRLVLCLAGLLVGCSYRPQPVSGQQGCAPAGGKRCPDGFYCAADDRCWKNGQGPGGVTGDDGGAPDGALIVVPGDGGSIAADGATTDSALADDGGLASHDLPLPVDSPPPPDLPPAVPAPSSRALAAAGTISESATYRAVRTLGQPPGGNAVRSSATYRSIGGLVGATQR